jgi:starch phosphorylase
LSLGRRISSDTGENFNMAYLAIRGCGAINGVSRLHGQVSRQILGSLFPDWPESEVPVGYITNGVHIPSWDSKEADDIWTSACQKDRWMGITTTIEKDIRTVPADKLWQMRNASRNSLIEYTRKRLSGQLEASGAPQGMIEEAKHLFDPDILTMGFARRFASYKRPNLLLNNPERLLRILTNSQFPVQLIIAGKAHPSDLEGQELIRDWIHFIRQTKVRSHVIFLSDYDMLLTENLVQGIDVWINTPRRPWEACGTSGMKVLVNGGLNLSELDGWWAEAYTPAVGWSVGDGQEHGSDPNIDAAEAEEIYNLLEGKVIPAFYNRDNNNVPSAWVKMMIESMALLTPQFSADRAVREYTEQHYLHSAEEFIKRSEGNGKAGQQIVEWQHYIADRWTKLHFGNVNIINEGDHYVFEIQVFLNDLDPNTVRAELYADASGSNEMVRMTMNPAGPDEKLAGAMVYRVEVAAKRPVTDFTVRLIPFRENVAIPLESSHILWQR